MVHNTGEMDEQYDASRFWGDVQYCIWQAEVGVSGSEHLQGYVAFNKKKLVSSLKKLSYKAHWEPRHGTHVQVKEYCMKADNRVAGPWEIGSEEGIANGRGARTDIDQLKADMDKGMDLAELAAKHTLQFIITIPLYLDRLHS